MKHLHTRLNIILNYVTAGLMILFILSLLLPYFNYPTSTEGGKTVISCLGYLGFPAEFKQINDVMDLKYITLKQLFVPVLLIVFAVVELVVSLRKSGLPVAVISFFWALLGMIGYLTSDFLALANMYGKWVTFAILFITFAASALSAYQYIKELRNRKEEDFISLIDG